MKLLLMGLVAFASVVFIQEKKEKKNLLKPTNKLTSWRFEQVDGGKGEIRESSEAIVFKVNEVDSIEWHVQAVQTDLDLQEGKEYEIKFQAKSPERRSISINAMIDKEDWHGIGLQEELYLTKEFSDFDFRFKAERVEPKKNRISIVVGNAKGEVHIKNMVMTEL